MHCRRSSWNGSRKYTIHDFIDPADPDALLDEVGPKIHGILAGGMKGPNANLINRLPNLEIISSFSVGFDATDVVAAQARDVIVTHTPVLTGDVADLAMTFILMAPRRIGEAGVSCATVNGCGGVWNSARRYAVSSEFGPWAIGKAVARRAEVFGLHISYFDIKPMGDLPYRSIPRSWSWRRQVTFSWSLAKVAKPARSCQRRRDRGRRPQWFWSTRTFPARLSIRQLWSPR